jgi:hypothetical protein
VADDDFMQSILSSEDLRPSLDGVESNHTAGFGMDFNSTAMPGAQNHSPGITPWCDEIFDIPPWKKV